MKARMTAPKLLRTYFLVGLVGCSSDLGKQEPASESEDSGEPGCGADPMCGDGAGGDVSSAGGDGTPPGELPPSETGGRPGQDHHPDIGSGGSLASGGAVAATGGGAVGGSPNAGGATGVGGTVPGSGGHLPGAPAPDLLYRNSFDSLTDLDEVQASLVSDHTDALLTFEEATDCVEGACVSVLHDYGGENQKTAKVNGEYSFGASSVEATMHYWVSFDSDFDFRKQGKLPGMIPLAPHFGGNKDDPPHPDKWSVRVMWLKTGDADLNGIVKPDLYLYDQDRQQGQTGEHNNHPGFSFVRDTWHHVTLYVSLNTDGMTRDGRAELWVDGELMSCRSNKLFRGNVGPASEIQKIAFHNYFGGGADYDWPLAPQRSYFDEITIVEGRDTPSVPGEGECDPSIRNE